MEDTAPSYTPSPDNPSCRLRSASVTLGPSKPGRRSWAKIIRAGIALPLPSAIYDARCIPGRFLTKGDDELGSRDVLFEGERHEDGRWQYRAIMATPMGAAAQFSSCPEAKARLKLQGMELGLLAGSGDLAALVRMVHGIRVGMNPFPEWARPLVSALALDACAEVTPLRQPRMRL